MFGITGIPRKKKVLTFGIPNKKTNSKKPVKRPTSIFSTGLPKSKPITKKPVTSIFSTGNVKQKPKPLGASLFQQKRWGKMTPRQKSFNRKLLPDRDGDKVPDLFDCRPRNPKRQDSKKKDYYCESCMEENLEKPVFDSIGGVYCSEGCKEDMEKITDRHRDDEPEEDRDVTSRGWDSADQYYADFVYELADEEKEQPVKLSKKEQKEAEEEMKMEMREFEMEMEEEAERRKGKLTNLEEKGVNDIFRQVQKERGITTGDISPGEHMELEDWLRDGRDKDEVLTKVRRLYDDRW